MVLISYTPMLLFSMNVAIYRLNGETYRSQILGGSPR